MPALYVRTQSASRRTVAKYYANVADSGPGTGDAA